MKKIKEIIEIIKEKTNKRDWAGLVVIIALSVAAAVGYMTNTATVEIKTSEDGKIESSIVLAEEQVPTLITDSDGEEVEISAPTVQSVENTSPIKSDECPADKDCGKGSIGDVSSPEAFKNSVLGKCIDTDGYYGSQCWDLANAFWLDYAGRWLDTCGTGAAKGTWNCKEKNAGNEFDLIADKNSLQAGDIIVFGNGQYGHIGMSMGNTNGNYISLLGTNQGGAPCAGGGAVANVINISLDNFVGAFRPKSYIKTEPIPEPETPAPISNCSVWNLIKGDTMGKIQMTCEGFVDWSTMRAYADTWRTDPNGKDKGATVCEAWGNGQTSGGDGNGVSLNEGENIYHEFNGKGCK